MKRNILNAILIFTGFLLSPLTWWNDPFVNIPISYLAAVVTSHFSPSLFSASFILFYWLSNILGIFLMYVGGKNIVRDKITRKKQFWAVVIYTILILLLSLFGIIKPIKFL